LAPWSTEPAPAQSSDDDCAITGGRGVGGCSRMDIYLGCSGFTPVKVADGFRSERFWTSDGPLVMGLRLPSHDPVEHSTQLLQARPKSRWDFIQLIDFYTQPSYEGVLRHRVCVCQLELDTRCV
jgi:hypothetical protein